MAEGLGSSSSSGTTGSNDGSDSGPRHHSERLPKQCMETANHPGTRFPYDIDDVTDKHRSASPYSEHFRSLDTTHINRSEECYGGHSFDRQLQLRRSGGSISVASGTHHQSPSSRIPLSVDITSPIETAEHQRVSMTYNSNQSRHGHMQYRWEEKYSPSRQRGVSESQEGQVIKAMCFFMDKCNKIGSAEMKKFIATSFLLSIQTVANVFQTEEKNIRIMVNEELAVSNPARVIVILANCASTSKQFIIVEVMMCSEVPYPELVCVRIPADGVFTRKLSVDISRELSVKKMVMCENGCLLNGETIIRNGEGQVRRLQAVHNAKITVKCVHQPAFNVKTKFKLETDSGTDVRHLKEEFLKRFKESIILGEDQKVHFSSKGRFLGDEQCLGAIFWPKRVGSFHVHVASARAICATLSYKDTTGKNAVKSRSIAIEPDMPTASLRQEVAKHMVIDPKAVKLTVNNRRIEEVDRIADVGGIENGCILVGGVKKRKSLSVINAQDKREETFSVYTLEPVHVLLHMIAEKFGIDPLQISLLYKGRRLNESELLLNYPIKNQTEISLHVYPKRIKLNVYIVFIKTRAVLLINNTDTTTVDDLIRYCAITYNFDRRCARVQCQDRCLSRHSTLTEENLENGKNVTIVFFDQPEKLEGGLIRIFPVRPDGQINERFGAVSGGHLLHASKKVKAQTSSRYTNEGEKLPEGIRVNEEIQMTKAELNSSKSKKDNPVLLNPMTDRVSASKLKALKKKFLDRAKHIKRNTHQYTRPVFRSPEQPRPELELVQHPSDVLLRPSEFSLDSETDPKRVSVSTNVSTSPAEEDGDTMDIAKHVKCIQDCCTQIKHVIHPLTEPTRENGECMHVHQSSAASQMIRNPESFITQETGEGIEKPAFGGETSGSASDLQMARTTVEFTLGSESSDQGAGPTQGYPYRITLDDLGRCPFIQQRLRHPRRRTITEGEQELPEHHLALGILRHTSTYPVISHPFYAANEWLNTAGITTAILETVSRKVGRKWKHLARKLSVPEEDIVNIDETCRELQEKAFQMILCWKIGRGREASKELLIQALEGIGMRAVVEYIEECCGNQTV